MDNLTITIPEEEFSLLIDSLIYIQSNIPDHKNRAYDLLAVTIQAMQAMRRSAVNVNQSINKE